jgi:hypothetical protein
MASRYSESTLRILQALDKRHSDNVELGILKHLIDCIAAIKEIYSITSNAEDRNPLQLLLFPFINQIGHLLKDCYLETSPISRCSNISRPSVARHILRNFPQLGTQRISDQDLDLPLVHYAVYNCPNLEMIRSLSDWNPAMLQTTDSKGALPLHWATLDHPVVSLQEKSEIHTFILDQCPTCVLQEDNQGRLPLHWAVDQDSPSLALVTQLVELSRDSVSKPSDQGLLPLHLAVNRAQPIPELVMYLLDCYPEGISEPCRQGWLPLHYCANRHDVNLSILKLLVEKYPEGVSYRSNLGQVPLHRLLDRVSPAKRAAKFLIQTEPDSLKVADNDGCLPLHTVLSSSEPPASSLVKLMVHSSFPSARQKNNDGWLPVHLAIKLSDKIHPREEGIATENPSDPSAKRSFETQETSDQKGGGGGVLPLQRIVAILQELLSVFPESLDEYVVDLVPAQGSDCKEPWRKVRWTPMSFALSKGKNSPLARALRPFRKKSPLAPTPPHGGEAQSPSNMILPFVSRSPPKHAASIGDLVIQNSSSGGFLTPHTHRSLHRPHDAAPDSSVPLPHFSSFASPKTPDSPAPLLAMKTAPRQSHQRSNPPPQDLRQDSFSDLV